MISKLIPNSLDVILYMPLERVLLRTHAHKV